MDLRSRLSRIRELNSGGKHAAGRSAGGPEAPPESPPQGRPFEKAGWNSLGPYVLKREWLSDLPFSVPRSLPPALDILVPGIGRTVPASLRFFDLETTGLSRGAGTVAFLAAFGALEDPPISRKRGARPLSGAPVSGADHAAIRITQYLLLDYPGEADFLEALHGEFELLPVIVSYNGKAFDAPILQNRCLMNGISPPSFGHLDLLYSARRMWRRFLPNCSQGTVETEVLALSREGDIPGALAPDAWFSFLKDGDAAALLQVCDHNGRDILGLASILGALCRIARDPLGGRFHPDPEQLWLCWWGALRRGSCGEGEYPLVRALLERGAELGYPRCCRKLAVEAEWRRNDTDRALDLVERALGFQPAPGPEDGGGPHPGFPSGRLREDLEKRRERLLSKTGRRGPEKNL
ncbi:MAG: ribonuclease H-like domain-containing protein [Treponema sp.]|jgi:hypothetical protein|nr:ribonuclease H-like domain-containing protein [Treponema sp.]